MWRHWKLIRDGRFDAILSYVGYVGLVAAAKEKGESRGFARPWRVFEAVN